MFVSTLLLFVALFFAWRWNKATRSALLLAVVAGLAFSTTPLGVKASSSVRWVSARTVEVPLQGIDFSSVTAVLS